MRRGVLAWGAVVALAIVGAVLLARPTHDRVSCGPGFAPSGARCMPGSGCPAPLVLSGGTCEAAMRVGVPKTRLVVGPSDWEAEGRVAPRTVDAGPFWIDAFEATAQALAGHPVPDGLRAASRVTRREATDYCAKVGGRLPSEDEWMVAAAGLGGHRYPWGETGAVCRRAAFGLARGPCSSLGTGPDTVGAHMDGDSAHGVHDLAGNVAEWVAASAERPGVGVAKGGSWRTELATELRVWARLELDPEVHDDRVGVRCAYDGP
jgi:formylglycine-generating enzyme required for sulfatase activity